MTATRARTSAARKRGSKRAPAKKAAARKGATGSKRAPAKKAAARKGATGSKRAPAKKAAARKGATGSKRAPAKKAAARKRTTRVGSERRRDPEPQVSGFRSGRATKRRGRRGRGRTRRKRRATPVTDAGERNAAFLTATVLGLTLFGLVMVLSASSVSSLYQYADSPFFQFKRQLIWAGLGAVAFLGASRVDYRRLRPASKPLLVVTILLLLALFVPGLGIEANHSTRWLGVGPFVLQPSELAKLVLIIFVADLLARRERRMDRPELTVRPVMLVLILLSLLIVPQPKLGTPIIMAGVTIVLLFVAGARMRSLLAWLSVAFVGAAALAYLAPYRRRRLLSFLNP
ncbi:MAG: FtsW/RodA/SpoVE family cell cycle protein [Acidimicrobiia bacterium]|nr:FtsW/RodA/SpoVE family cell cycle protein [Acidimicrobiia bacterium]